MELNKVMEGFTVSNNLVIKAQVQVIRCAPAPRRAPRTAADRRAAGRTRGMARWRHGAGTCAWRLVRRAHGEPAPPSVPGLLGTARRRAAASAGSAPAPHCRTAPAPARPGEGVALRRERGASAAPDARGAARARRDRPHAPFRCLDAQYRRELVRVYLTNVEALARKFVDEKRDALAALRDDAAGFRAFWGAVDARARRQLATASGEAVLKARAPRPRAPCCRRAARAAARRRSSRSGRLKGFPSSAACSAAGRYVRVHSGRARTA